MRAGARWSRSAAGLGLASASLMGVAHATCPATPEVMATQARDAESAYARQDFVGFAAARAAMLDTTRCLTASPTPAQVADVHRIQALWAFRADQEEEARASLLAMHSANPEADLALDYAPSGHDLRLWLTAFASQPPSARSAVTPAPGLTLVVDGVATWMRPTDRPALIVLVREDNVAACSGLLPPASGLDALPGCSKALPPPLVVVPPPPHPGRRWFVASAGAGALAGGLLAVTLAQDAAVRGFTDQIAAGEAPQGWTLDDFDRHVAAGRASGVAAGLTGSAALSLLMVGLVVTF